MLKLAAVPKFTHEVKVQVPVDGGFEEQTFKATFKVLPADEVARRDLMSEKGMRDYLSEICVRFDDIADEGGNPVPFNDGLRERMLSVPYIRVALMKTYATALAGAKAGN
jgi:hypothetical protein